MEASSAAVRLCIWMCLSVLHYSLHLLESPESPMTHFWRRMRLRDGQELCPRSRTSSGVIHRFTNFFHIDGDEKNHRDRFHFMHFFNIEYNIRPIKKDLAHVRSWKTCKSLNLKIVITRPEKVLEKKCKSWECVLFTCLFSLSLK